MNSTPRSPASLASLLLAAVCALNLGGLSARAQQPSPTPVPTVAMDLKDGRSIAAAKLHRVGDSVLATVPSGTSWASVGYPVGAIAKIHFPEPSQLQATVELLLKGNNPGALVQIDPIINYYDSFKDIPGSWWAAAARLKLKASLNLHRDAAIDALIDEMVKAAGTDPEAARMASVLQATNMGRKGDNEKALPIFDDVIKTSTDDETMAYAWVGKGASLFALQKFDSALLAYLHVPVFYPDEKLLMPTVLLGAGKCYVRIENLPEAENTFKELLDQFPSSPEADAARAELKKLSKSLPAATPAPPSTTPTPTPTPAPPANP